MQQSMGLYAHRVQYDDSEYQYAYYWHKLTHQQGILFDADSHLGDHEPTIVRVDSDGVIDRVTYTFYHHLADSAFLEPVSPERSERGRRPSRPTSSSDRPAVAQLCRRRGHTLAAGVVPRCPRRRRRLSPPDVGDAGHLRPNGR